MSKQMISNRTMTILTGLFFSGAVLLVFGDVAKRGSARARIAEEERTEKTYREISERLAAADAVGELKVTIREWDVPTKGRHPHALALAPEGCFWVTGRF